MDERICYHMDVPIEIQGILIANVMIVVTFRETRRRMLDNFLGLLTRIRQQSATMN